MEIIKEITSKKLFDFSQTIACELFESATYPHEILPKLGDWIKKFGTTLNGEQFEYKGENIWIHKTAKVHKSAQIAPCTIICANAEIRPFAYIRGSVIVGENAVVGNSTELKNCILFNCVQVPHYNYVGDSIMGYKSHAGAGVIMSNVKGDKSAVTIRGHGYNVETGLKKLGGIIGDFAEIGCNSVINPGSVVGKNATIQPLSFVRGIIPKNSIHKQNGVVVKKR